MESLSKCPKHGLHNPFKDPERFVFVILLLLVCTPPMLSSIHPYIPCWRAMWWDTRRIFLWSKWTAILFNRYLLFGDISAKAAHLLSQPKVTCPKLKDYILLTPLRPMLIGIIFCFRSQVSDFFTRLIQRVSPKSYQQAYAEVYVTRKFLENFSGDQV